MSQQIHSSTVLKYLIDLERILNSLNSLEERNKNLSMPVEEGGNSHHFCQSCDKFVTILDNKSSFEGLFSSQMESLLLESDR